MGFFDDEDRGGGEGYDVAQICLNGHVINSTTQRFPQFNKKFCPRCGQATISQCQQCSNSIQGEYHGGALVIASWPAPAFCINCGASHPWTQSRLAAARELALDSEHLNDADKETLSKSLDDLVKDTPFTPVTANRFKKLMVKVGKEGAAAFRDILVDIVSDTAKKIIWPNQP
jgi:hypothetical protein